MPIRRIPIRQPRITRIEADRQFLRRDCLLDPARQELAYPEISDRDDPVAIGGDRDLVFRNGRLVLPLSTQELPFGEVGEWMAWRDRQYLLDQLLGSIDILGRRFGQLLEHAPGERSCKKRPRVDRRGVQQQRLLEMRDCLGHTLARCPFRIIEGRSSAQDEIKRIRVIAGLRRFGSDQFKVECDRNLAGYFVLQREQVVGVMVEPFGPYMRVPFRVDQLRIDPDALSRRRMLPSRR